MAKKITNLPDNTPDLLVKPKSAFETSLNDRIRIGEELYSSPVLNQAEYSKLYEAYRVWDDYNSEFLSRAFNKVQNQYYKDYNESPMMYMTSSMAGTPTFQDRIDDLKSEIHKYLARLKRISAKLDLIDEIPNLKKNEVKTDIQSESLSILSSIFYKFHRVAQSLRHRHANRETLIISDEYDVQDLLRGLLQVNFNDIREEDYSPSYAGGNSRVDFVLKNEDIVIETKMTNTNLKDKEVGQQLSIDIVRYRAHPNCKTLIVFVYDKGDYIRNKIGLIKDLERMSSPELQIKIFIQPE